MDFDVAADSDPSSVGWPDPDGSALLFDFDGVLVAIAESPGSVVLEPRIREALIRLHGIFGGAVAVVSGRPVDQLSALLRIDGLPLAGVHGLEIRDAEGRLRRSGFDSFAYDALVAGACAFAAGHPDLLVETKPGSVALHYRRRPDLGDPVLEFAERLAVTIPGAKLTYGKMVAELRLGGRSKADAVRMLMGLAGFVGRKPWVFGDDVTDEDGFGAANALGGRSFKVGPGPTVAGSRFADIDAFHRWLLALAGSKGTGRPAASGRPSTQSRTGRRSAAR